MKLEGKILHLMSRGISSAKDEPHTHESIIGNFSLDKETGLYLADKHSGIISEQIKIFISGETFNYITINTFGPGMSRIEIEELEKEAKINENNVMINRDEKLEKHKRHNSMTTKPLVLGKIKNHLPLEVYCLSSANGGWESKNLFNQDFFSGENIPEDFIMIRETPIKTNELDLYKLFDDSNPQEFPQIPAYIGKETIKEQFNHIYAEFMNKQGNIYVQKKIDRKNNWELREKELHLRAIEETKRIFPENLVKQSEEYGKRFFAEEVATGEAIAKAFSVKEIIKGNRHPLPENYNPNQRGMEESLFSRTTGKKTDQYFKLPNQIQVPVYELDERSERIVSQFLGCIPDEAAKVYSILKYEKERHQGGLFQSNGLGFSQQELRDFVIWIHDPTRNLF